MRLLRLLSLASCLAALSPVLPPGSAAAQAGAKRARAKADKTSQLHAGQRVALLPISSSAADTGGAAHAISEHLRSLGFRVLTPQQVKAQLSAHALDSCTNAATCDAGLALATLGVDAVISAAVWARPAAPPQLAVHVRHRHGYGQSEVSASGNQDRALRAAAVTALRNALEDSRQTHEIAVWIESEPSGASVHVDQTLSGSTPARFALLPGSHLVSVEAPGYVARAQYLELRENTPREPEPRIRLKLEPTVVEPAAVAASASGADEGSGARAHDRDRGDAHAPEAESEHQATFELQASLEPPASAPAPSAEAHSPSALNYVLAASLLGVSVPFLANAAYAGATHDACVGRLDPGGRCSERVTLGPLFFVSLGVGVLAAASGSAFLIFEPLSDREPSQTTARLRPLQRF